MLNKVVVVVENGEVSAVYGNTEIELQIINLDDLSLSEQNHRRLDEAEATLEEITPT